MGIFDRLERKVEGAVSSAFARAFKGDVQPVEITARLQRELDGEAKLMSRDKRLVPNEFAVQLSQHDHDKLGPYAKTLSAELAAAEKPREMASSTDRQDRFEQDSRMPKGGPRASKACGIASAAGQRRSPLNRANLVLR